MKSVRVVSVRYVLFLSCPRVKVFVVVEVVGNPRSFVEAPRSFVDCAPDDVDVLESGALN
jgi:hypothetical protein